MHNKLNKKGGKTSNVNLNQISEHAYIIKLYNK